MSVDTTFLFWVNDSVLGAEHKQSNPEQITNPSFV